MRGRYTAVVPPPVWPCECVGKTESHGEIEINHSWNRHTLMLTNPNTNTGRRRHTQMACTNTNWIGNWELRLKCLPNGMARPKWVERLKQTSIKHTLHAHRRGVVFVCCARASMRRKLCVKITRKQFTSIGSKWESATHWNMRMMCVCVCAFRFSSLYLSNLRSDCEASVELEHNKRAALFALLMQIQIEREYNV